MDTIFLNGLCIDTIIGIYEWERSTKQTLIFDIAMAFDINKASQTDDLQYTLDYKKVSDRVTEFVQNTQYYLIERLISEVAELILTEFKVTWVQIKLNKRGAVGKDIDVGIIIERGKK
ncbi:MAG: dihydroneopterin aldolase [Methylovulum sp.]|nr:dihydroneopterin aldolase [Methylovulum sp.]